MEPKWDEQFIIELEGSENLRILVYEQTSQVGYFLLFSILLFNLAKIKVALAKIFNFIISFLGSKCITRTSLFRTQSKLVVKYLKRAEDQHERRGLGHRHEVRNL